ncbi:hypothetical protein BDF21DRAFT_444713 [Thamnidium elegans]|uniref:C2 domain-containing protein n=1 Tax=Thamnidium elegans TaxID=101142 RepID=A0A8H7STF8_9FUNG|nr:hypothetical protein INT48_005279 [Thamnidium elegans]KAI8079357.1 hypothetical protein BDF21DRAFT_444713 [Thamnidium elegans]
MSKPRIIGELVIVAYKARHLPEREIVGKQDPFVVFRLGETTKKTKTDLRGGQHPTWDDQVNLPVPEKKTLVIVQVYDEDAKRQELISECELDITKVLEDGEADDWYPLQYKGRSAGEIYLELTFYTAKPPPKRQPTRYGGRHPKPTGFSQPPLPQQTPLQTPQQSRPYNPSPYPPSSFVRPAGPIPVESHSTPTYQGSPYPPQQQQQPPQQQQRPPFNINSSPYPPPVPTPSMSTGSQHVYPPQQQQQRPSRPNSYIPPPTNSRPTSPPGPGSYGSHTSASLLSSSYNPSNPNGPPRPNSGYGGYPPVSGNNPNRNSFPNSYASPHPPQQSQHGFNVGGFPEPQQFSTGYVPHTEALGTPFAAHQGTPFASHQGTPFSAHQGTFHNAAPHGTPGYPPANPNYPPQQQQQQYQGYPPNGGYGGGQAPYPPY